MPAVCRTSAYLAAAAMAAPFLYHLARGSKAFLGLFEDDYFFYVTVADKLATLGKLTYDERTITNGFHPLWFALLAVLRTVFGRFTPSFYVALTLTFFAAMLVSYELSRRLSLALHVREPFAALIALAFSFGTDRLMCTGMECVVAVPLFLWLLIEAARELPLSPSRAGKLGFIASLAVLARLDIAAAVALLILGWLLAARPGVAHAARALGAFAAGGALLPIYAIANFSVFGSILPVSAQAKQLLTDVAINWTYVRHAALYTFYGAAVAFVLPLGCAALVLLVRKGRRGAPAAYVVGAAVLVFTLLFYAWNSLSGWVFFGWYAYPLACATVVGASFLVSGCAPLFDRFPRLTLALAALLVIAVPARALRHFVYHGPRWSVGDNAILAMSYDLADHLRGREGLFAMGAMSGVVAHVIDKPVLQLEGLVADRAMIEHIRAQDSLGPVLAAYGADYLIVSFGLEPVPKRGDCYLIVQPNPVWAGDVSKKMRGEICAEPVEHFVTEPAGRPWSMFLRLETFVFDLRHARWRNSSLRLREGE